LSGSGLQPSEEPERLVGENLHLGTYRDARPTIPVSARSHARGT
jgi:hypothetical protein